MPAALQPNLAALQSCHLQALHQPISAMEDRSSIPVHAPVASTSQKQPVVSEVVGHMIAGAAAGMAEHTAMYPVDTIKTRMQALSHPGAHLHRSSVRQALQTVLRREGLAGLYRGVGAVAIGAGPAHAIHFAVYERAKEIFGGNRSGYQVPATAAAGATATLAHDAIMTPVDVVKQRLQMAHSPYKGILDCVSRVLREEGIGALYRSYRITVLMNIPFAAVHFSVYEAAKKWLNVNSEEDEGLMVQLIAGGLAGGTAAAITTPLDVVKTRLQTEGVLSPRRHIGSAVLPVLRRIIQDEGVTTLWRGWKPRVLFHVPAAAVSWGTYETVKGLLGVS